MNKEIQGLIVLGVICATLVIMCGLGSWAWVVTH